jgi:FKBP-type peptidyl-prolyl cis-trans isomerase SlyD
LTAACDRLTIKPLVMQPAILYRRRPFGLGGLIPFLCTLFKFLSMKIDKHTVASVTYTLSIEGQEIEQAGKDNPLTFLVGVGMMIPGFENQLLGKAPGDSYNITVEPSEGYGEVNDDAIAYLPISVFMVDGQLQEDMLTPGMVIPLQDQDGNPMEATILEVEEERVKMDFNHMLAGKTLNFSGEVLEVRQATAEEIDHGHVHGPGGHHH